MKIIIAHYKYYIQGGPEKYLLKFKALAEKHGHIVIPFSIDYKVNMPCEYSHYFAKPPRNSTTGMYNENNKNILGMMKKVTSEFTNRNAYKQLKKLIADEKPDLLYVLIPGMLSADIFKAAREASIPIILRLSDFRYICGRFDLLRKNEICEECIYGNYLALIKNKCVKDSMAISTVKALALYYNRKFHKYDCVDAVIAPPNYTAQKYIESGYFPKNKMFVNPTFIDYESIQPDTKVKDYVLCLGRFSPQKGFIYVVKALKYLKDIPVRVAVTGDYENCDEQLKKVITKYDLIDKVSFVGFLQGGALEKITSEALCVAAPAIWYENLPNVVLEAYAYGRPVIASNLGSLAEIVEDGKTGLLFEPKNPKAIAECIRKLYEDKALCAEMGRNARIKCESEFSPEAHWSKFMEIYESVQK